MSAANGQNVVSLIANLKKNYLCFRPNHCNQSCGLLQTKIAQTPMIIGTAAKRPAVFALRLRDWQVVYACRTHAHETVRIKFPVLVPVGTEPVSRVIVPFIRKSDGHPIILASPNLLDQSILQLFGPFALKKSNNLLEHTAKLRIENEGMHGFRHGHVTALMESGVPACTIKAWIGHGSEKMVDTRSYRLTGILNDYSPFSECGSNRNSAQIWK